MSRDLCEDEAEEAEVLLQPTPVGAEPHNPEPLHPDELQSPGRREIQNQKR